MRFQSTSETALVSRSDGFLFVLTLLQLQPPPLVEAQVVVDERAVPALVNSDAHVAVLPDDILGREDLPGVLDLHAGLGVLEDVVVLARQHSSRVHEDSALLGSDHTAQSLAREPRATPLTHLQGAPVRLCTRSVGCACAQCVRLHVCTRTRNS